MLMSKAKFVNNKILKSIICTQILKRNLVFNLEEHFEDSGFKLHLLDQGPSPTVELSKADGLKYYKQMHVIRSLEHGLAELYMKRIVRGFCHLYVGQESIAVGMFSQIRPQDTVITSYRCHAWAVMMGGSVEAIFAELIGNVNGVARGKGGSMHLYSHNFFGGNGIVGGHVPLGVGIALKHKHKGTDAISVTLFGDGAANQGQVFEAYNIAKLLMLPVIFVIENNHYGMGTSSHRSSANPEHYRQCAYIPGIRLNGNDILAVIEASKFAVKHVLDGKGPIILEMMTYRYYGHSMSDPGTAYRSRDEVKEVREKKDPVTHLRLLMMKSNLATEEEMKKVRKETKDEVEKEMAKALKGKPPPLEELTADCYKTYPGLMRTPKMLTFVPHKTIAKYEDKAK